MKTLDLITIGRTSVDLYGDQLGEQLKHMVSFSMYVGGSPTNTAIGAAKLGLKVGHITKVGDESLGEFIIESLQKTGVNTDGVVKDPNRLTSTTVLGINGREKNTLVYFRENCADANLIPEDIDPGYIECARAVLISGTMFYTPSCRKTCKAIIEYAKKYKAKLILDVDYRPVFIETEEENQKISELTCSILDQLDLVVGTKEELSWLTGNKNDRLMLQKLRDVTSAVIVLKVGADGCMVFPDAIPNDIRKGVTGQKFKVTVCNVFGAGDAFMGGFLRGWLKAHPFETCITWGNACGAIVVSRHGCSPESPSWQELQLFLDEKFDYFNKEDKARLEHVHWATSLRPKNPKILKCLAMDHQWQFIKLLKETEKCVDDIKNLKKLIFEGFLKAGKGHEHLAILMDDTFCEDLILEAGNSFFQIIRRTEAHREKVSPIQFLNGPSISSVMHSWPHDHIAKMLVYFHEMDPEHFKRHQLCKVEQLYSAARATGHQIILEPIPSLERPVINKTTGNIIEEIYKRGVKPDWWKIDPPEDEVALQHITEIIEKYDPFCKGFLLLGKHHSVSDMNTIIEQNRKISPYCSGFAIGRPIFWEVASAWMKNKANDLDVINQVEKNFNSLLNAWK